MELPRRSNHANCGGSGGYWCDLQFRDSPSGDAFDCLCNWISDTVSDVAADPANDVGAETVIRDRHLESYELARQLRAPNTKRRFLSKRIRSVRRPWTTFALDVCRIPVSNRITN